MPDKCVLDSSIIAAIFFTEKSSKKAMELVQDKTLYTVELAIAEVANVAWKRAAFFDENRKIIEKALKKGIEFINTSCEVIHMDELIEESFVIAINENITIYDSMFLAAAEREKIPLYTLDKKLGIRDSVVVIN